MLCRVVYVFPVNSPVCPVPRIWLSLLATVCFVPLLAVGQSESLWLAEGAKSDGAGLFLPDVEAEFDMDTADAVGITIGPKPPEGRDSKSLQFSGQQALALRTQKPFPGLVQKLTVSFRVNVGEIGEQDDATVLRYGTQWEIRHLGKASAFILVVWHGVNVVTQIRAASRPGEWQEVEAEITPEKMTLKVDDEEVEGVPQDTIWQESKAVNLLMGASAPRPLPGEPLARPFIGSLAEVRVSVE